MNREPKPHPRQPDTGVCILLGPLCAAGKGVHCTGHLAKGMAATGSLLSQLAFLVQGYIHMNFLNQHEGTEELAEALLCSSFDTDDLVANFGFYFNQLSLDEILLNPAYFP